MTTRNLLVEIGTEELPPTSLRKLAESFAANLRIELDKAELAFTDLKWLASPRRLALQVADLASAQQDKIVEKRGPGVKQAFDADGNPTKAALGWCRGNGISIEQAERLVTDKGEWLLHKAEVRGKSVAELLPDLVNAALAKLPIPKPMRWGAYRTQFIRPVKTITLLYGTEVIDGEVLGIKSGRKVQTHRFHGNGLLELAHADEYVERLWSEGHVMVDYQQRKNLIKQEVEAAAASENGIAQIDGSLLEEVTSLVEKPVTLVGSFEEKFLEVPGEALAYTMKGDQKYFPMLDQDGNLMPRFIFVSNIESKDPVQVIQGNEKVIRPRLADAEFFFVTDKKKTLASRLESLDTVLFQKQLGTLKDKSERISELSGFIAEQLGADLELAKRAGLLSKTDLMTEMVMEFPDVQGVMGMHYARHDGEHEQVALAQNEQYMPRFSGDQLPGSAIGQAVALADKLDTLVGIFGIGQAPKGDKDPFALRRAAIGILRIITEQKLPLDLVDLLVRARVGFGDKLTNTNVEADVLNFLFDRYRPMYTEQGVSVDVIQAVQARRPTKPLDFAKRISAVSHFRTLEQAAALAAANKRVGNILAKVEGELPRDVDTGLLQEDAEKTLAAAVADKQLALQPLFAQSQYQEALSTLAELRDAVDSFFDNVMVMAEDQSLRNNRLALLSQLRGLFLQVADISLLQS